MKPWAFITIHLQTKRNLGISVVELMYLQMVYVMQASQRAHFRGWCNAPNCVFMEALDISERTLQGMVKKLTALGLIESQPGAKGQAHLRRTTPIFEDAMADEGPQILREGVANIAGGEAQILRGGVANIAPHISIYNDEIKTESYARPAVPATASLEALRAAMERDKLAALNAKDTLLPPPVASPPPAPVQDADPAAALLKRLQTGVHGDALKLKMQSMGVSVADLKAFAASFLCQREYIELTTEELMAKVAHMNIASVCSRAATWMGNGMKGRQAVPRREAVISEQMMRLPG
jgi:hypothetical protein